MTFSRCLAPYLPRGDQYASAMVGELSASPFHGTVRTTTLFAPRSGLAETDLAHRSCFDFFRKGLHRAY